MSLRLALILSVLLVSIYADDKAAAPAKTEAPKEKPAAAASSSSKDTKKSEKTEEEKESKNKMKVGGGLYTTDKVANVKSMKGNRPVSIIQDVYALTILFIRL